MVSRRQRAVWLCVLSMFSLHASSRAVDAADDREGFTPIFDGMTLDSWRGRHGFWSVRDGAITGETTTENPTEGNTFLLYKDEISDFELRLKFKIASGNSGIQYRSIDQGNSVVHGYQADLDSTEEFMGDLYDEGRRGTLAKAGTKVEIGFDGKKEVVSEFAQRKDIAAMIHWKDWNDYSVIAIGNRLVHKINGFETVDVIDNEAGKALARGVLALQLHAGPPMRVQFKDIRLRHLK